MELEHRDISGPKGLQELHKGAWQAEIEHSQHK